MNCFLFLMSIITFTESEKILLDPSKSDDFICNDQLDRLWFRFTYENTSEIFEKSEDLILHYSYQPCSESNDCGPKHLATINSSTSILRLIINSAYSYKIEISTYQKFKNITNDKLCNNFEFYQFVECGQYGLNIASNGSCSLFLISNEMEFSIVKYVYLFFGLTLSLVVMAKYQIIK
ncbi:hypothetical protein BpHYR1_000536 [Brachionus plicatilis]|uniref:Uncharacterized protein n=1 Tax=Brachionus plicatilis TaxID=10195 RepID=A0A3M7PK96_BRAPC|nr:hypothetical protein BpHYR1_000536 [Brachionus plicatilis]